MGRGAVRLGRHLLALDGTDPLALGRRDYSDPCPLPSKARAASSA